MKIPDAEAAVDKEWKKLETIPAWDLGKVKSKKDVILETQSVKMRVHFATLMDIATRRMLSWNPNYKSFKHSRAQRRHCKKNGAYAVFTEQSSSSSQMTAAKIMLWLTSS